MSAKGEHTAQGRPFSEQMEGPAGDLPSISDKHIHTEKDYCQLVYFHNVIFVFRKLELSLKEKNGRKDPNLMISFLKYKPFKFPIIKYFIL